MMSGARRENALLGFAIGVTIPLLAGRSDEDVWMSSPSGLIGLAFARTPTMRPIEPARGAEMRQMVSILVHLHGLANGRSRRITEKIHPPVTVDLPSRFPEFLDAQALGAASKTPTGLQVAKVFRMMSQDLNSARLRASETGQPRPARSGTKRRRSTVQPSSTEEPRRAAAGTLSRTRSLVLAALRVWELKQGIR